MILSGARLSPSTYRKWQSKEPPPLARSAPTGRMPTAIIAASRFSTGVASGGRPNIVLEGDRQPAPVVPAPRGLLAHVGPARFNAQTFDVARRAIRHLAPAADLRSRPASLS